MSDPLDAVRAAVPDVSRETGARLTHYVELLKRWQATQNLVAPSTIDSVWTRHIADSAQVHRALPEARVWVDLGSGAGFPGLVTAILMWETPGAHVHLVESNRGKAAFLRTVIREVGAPATVHAVRIDSFSKSLTVSPDAISARALAPLIDLFGHAAPLMRPNTVCVFHKGQDFVAELEEATQSWVFDVIEQVSQVDPAGRLLLIRNLTRRC